ncbi:MAG TPA: biotin/lipoyl-binding protein [Firmicutes bacterium]|nr:biotin/lipoyl-binding protein [Bacillota bacterium]
MKRFNITVNGNAYDVQVEELGASAPAAAPAAPAAAPAPAPAAAPEPAAPAAAPAPAAGAETLNAPMPGTILDIKVKAGDTVEKGQVLLILEAMKMENEIMAPHDAVIAGVHVNKGDSVDSGKLLISLQ